jgi:large repetitive protein
VTFGLIDFGVSSVASGVLEATGPGGLTVDDAVNSSATGIVEANGGNATILGNLTGGKAQIFSGNQLELKGASNNTAASFQDNAGDTGVLVLDKSVGFHGTVAGFYFDLSHSDTLDLQDIKRASSSWSFLENASGNQGVLTVKDGSHTANITLLGQYLAANTSATSASSSLFLMAADNITNTTGTLITTTHQAP